MLAALVRPLLEGTRTHKLETASRRAGGNDVRADDTKSLLNYDRGPLVSSLPESATALEQLNEMTQRLRARIAKGRQLSEPVGSGRA